MPIEEVNHGFNEWLSSRSLTAEYMMVRQHDPLKAAQMELSYENYVSSNIMNNQLSAMNCILEAILERTTNAKS